jgi:RNA polymerase sigma-70 factor (ECF subfamily)
MSLLAEKHKSTIDESIAHLISRAQDPRGLDSPDVWPRVSAAVEKNVLGGDENASHADIKTFIDEIRADDLCLILACEKGIESAWNDLVANFDSTVKSAARSISKNSEDAEDLASSIWAELYGLKQDADGRLKSKLSYYSGRGSLAGWLRAVVNQLAVDQFRKMSRFVQIEENREFENLANESAEQAGNDLVIAHRDNPEELLTAKQTERDVGEAFQKAVAGLDPEDRLILKLYYFDDLKLKDIAATFGYHEATASRKLTRVQTEIRKFVEKDLRERHGWSEGEVKRYLSETASRLGISLETMFTVLLILAVMQEFAGSGVL